MATTATAVDYAFLRDLVFKLSQNVLDPSRDYLFDTRLTRVLRAQGMTHLEELVQHLRLRKNPTLERAVAEAMTINETSFFRDGRPFELLRTEMLPKMIEARRMNRTLRIWSAACSTGQEGYSIGMLLMDNFPELSTWNIRIEGTDLSSEVVERAQNGRYHRIEMNRGLPARNVVKYFDHIGEDWIVKPELKKITNFRIANLCERLPFHEKFDIIFLRNVMLYFSQDTRKALMANVHSLLAPDGVLFLGSAEQPADPSIWQAVLAGGTCHFRPVKKP